jgi:hypothetical protein
MRRLSAAAGIAVLLAVSGCAGSNPGSDEAARTAQDFHAALAEGDEQAACGLLTPAAADKVEEEDAGSCARKLSGLNLPEASAVVESKAYGRNAQVALDRDTVFLTLSGGSWKITGAGCTSRGENPYNCEVEGS